jgi:tripartite-type tricarboxylate transporter receptor subunit TctC
MAGCNTALTRRATLAVLALPALAWAQAPTDPQPPSQSPWPWPQDRPIRIILNGAAGSGADAVTRVLAQRLQEEFRQNVVVENLPAGAGVGGYQTAIRARRDGLTAICCISSVLLGPLVDQKLPFDVFNEAVPVSQLHTAAGVLCVSRALGVRTLEDFLAWARAQATPFPFGNYGHGTASHIHAALLTKRAELRTELVPYPGPQLVSDLMAGHVGVGFLDSGSVIAQLRSGDVLGLAVTGPRQVSVLPDLPTLVSKGMAGFEPQIWQGIFLPPDTPANIVEAWGAGVTRAVKSEPVSAKFRDIGFEPVGSSPEEFRAMLKREREIWAGVVAETGVRVP